MLIEIKRIYVGKGIVVPCLINSRYIRRIEMVSEDSKHYGLASIRIVIDDPNNSDNTTIMYSQDKYAAIKNKLTRASKIQKDD